MVQNHVDYDSDASLAGLCDESIEIGQRAVLRIDALIVGDVIAEVDHLRHRSG